MKKEYIIPYVKSFVALVIIIVAVLIAYYFAKTGYENEKIERMKKLKN